MGARSKIWNLLPAVLRRGRFGRAYGRYLHGVVCSESARKQYVATYFLRNRPELALMCRLQAAKPQGSKVDVLVLACSKGAEVYSIVWALRSARPDMSVTVHAVDIAPDVVEFAERGVYALDISGAGKANGHSDFGPGADVDWNTQRDQQSSIFERVTAEEMRGMFELDVGQAKIRPWLKQGINWICGDAGDPGLVSALGPQDIVVANRFLCHMQPSAAENCLRNIARFVRPGGYLFVSGVDLDIRTKVAKALGWKPVADLIEEVHDGDPSVREGWPLAYWGLEPFCHDQPDWRTRYASVFQVGDPEMRECCPGTR